MECREVHGLLDVYMDDELLVETNHGVLAHLWHCRACHGELNARQVLRTTLRNTFDSDRRFASRAGYSTLLRNRLRPGATEGAVARWLRRLPRCRPATRSCRGGRDALPVRAS